MKSINKQKLVKQSIAIVGIIAVLSLLICYFVSNGQEKMNLNENITVKMQFYKLDTVSASDLTYLKHFDKSLMFDNYKTKAIMLCEFSNDSPYELWSVNKLKIHSNGMFVLDELLENGDYIFYPNTDSYYVFSVYFKDDLTEQEAIDKIKNTDFEFSYEIHYENETLLSKTNTYFVKASIVDNQLVFDSYDYTELN